MDNIFKALAAMCALIAAYKGLTLDFVAAGAALGAAACCLWIAGEW